MGIKLLGMNSTCKDCELYLQCKALDLGCEIIIDIIKETVIGNNSVDDISYELTKKLGSKISYLFVTGISFAFVFDKWRYTIKYYDWEKEWIVHLWNVDSKKMKRSKALDYSVIIRYE